MFKDEHRSKVWDEIRQHDLPAFNRLLSPEVVTAAADRAGVRMGSGPLCIGNLCWLAVSAALHRGKSFADLLVITVKILSDQPGWEQSSLGRKCRTSRRSRARNKHDPRSQSLGTVTEEAFVQARQRVPLPFWTWLLLVLAERFEDQHAAVDRWKEFRLLMLDGSHVALPRWKTLIAEFGTAKNRRKKSNHRPQARIGMLALARSRVPWRYEITPWSTHEQGIAHRLLEGLRPNDLVLMDRGFWSFALFYQIAQQQAFFGIRLRSKIPLKTVKKLGPGDRLAVWRPNRKAASKGLVSRKTLPREITLRVLEYQIPGFRKSAVVTNVLDPKKISHAEWTQLAGHDAAGNVIEAGLYHRRWGIETMFYELKVRQGMARGLRGRTAATIHYEIAGHVLLYLLTRWLMVEAGEEHNADPSTLSFTAAQRELLDMRQTLLTANRQRIAQVLLPRLIARIAQHRIEPRPGRHYPRLADTYQSGKHRKRTKLRSKT